MRIINLIIFVMILLVAPPAVWAASWSGYVLDDNTIGINLANVSAVLNVGGGYVSSTLTDAAGFFSVSIPTNVIVKLNVFKTDYQDSTSQALPPIPLNVNLILPFNITLLLDLRGNITGRVTDHVGNSIVNAIVEAIQGGITKGSDIANINGDYLIANLRDGTYTVKITKDNITQSITNVVVLPGLATTVNFSVIFDVDVPVISNVEATLITSSEVTITWTTDEEANSSVYYGTDTSTDLSLDSSALTSSHLIILSSLSSNTLYYYYISSCDSTGNCNTSIQYNFTTLSPGDGEGGGYGCVTEWICDDWDECIGGVQTRTCNKERSYCFAGEKPDEAQTCIYTETESGIPAQLLDIRMDLENTIINIANKLTALISFENFGTDPVQVDLTYVILNELGEGVYSETGSTIVYTEIVIIKQFDNLRLDPGNYKLILNIEYGDGITEEFERKFEIKEDIIQYFVYVTAFVFISILLIVWLIRKSQKSYNKK